MSEPLPRPGLVTMAGWMIIGGAVLMVLTVFETITSLNTLETREAVAQFLSEPPGQGLGLDVSGALVALRTVSMIAAGCAAMAAVLGFHVLRRNRGARVGVTVLAVPLFFSGTVTGGLLSSVVAFSIALLWLEPSRNWFDGVPPGSDSARGTTGQRRTAPAQVVPEQRPAAVMWACVLTWVLSGLAATMMVLSALVIALEPAVVFDELRRQNPELGEQGVTDRAVQVATYVTAGVTVVWALAAVVLAVFVLRRFAWARVALLASAGGAGAVCLVASLGSLLMVLPAFGCAVTFSLLLRPEVRAWFAGA